MTAAAWAICAAFGLALTYIIHKGLVWVFYLAIMHLQEARDAGKLTERGALWGRRALAVGLVIDASFNLTWACAEFLDIPHELLVTDRLKRYKNDPNVKPWRLQKTNAYALDLLDPFDPSGKHIK